MRRGGRLRDGHLVTTMALLFLLPSLLFTSYLSPWPRLVLLVGVVSAVALVAVRPAPAVGSILARPLAWPRLGWCALAALLLILLGGEGHLFFANWDWLWRDAVLEDLIHSTGMPVYQVDGAAYWLRAPLGMYMAPALVGRLGTLGLAHAALVAQNATVLAGLFYFVVALSARNGGVVLLVFVAFGGMGIVGTYLLALGRGQTLVATKIPSMLDAWAQGLQYSSAVTQLFWVPNHCLPGWWLAILALLCSRKEIGVGELGLGVAACLIWSPLATIGVLPLAAVVLATRLDSRRDQRFWASALASLCFLPVAAYLVADSATVPHGLLITEAGYWMIVVIFLAIEIPHVLVLGLTWRRLPVDGLPLLVISVALLVALPMVKFGGNNDLLMRGSIPALAILALAFGDILAAGWRPQAVPFAAALAIAVVGAVTPAFEIDRAIRFPRFAVSTCDLVTVWKSQLPDVWLANYLASPNAMPAWLIAPASSPAPALQDEGRRCWPDMPFDPQMAVFTHSNAELEQAMQVRREERLER